ncbi:RNA polymerase sigma-70 factor [Sunxiuqinia indica]|uniref:RNA polymerase sigma-70 factor n=1 Tax=Sunxiuqinia indica TaxID=2692584 RepID=UPI00135B3421|nr:RNA polymerase sigma-70 factor [Sunxiuqinia indica]
MTENEIQLFEGLRKNDEIVFKVIYNKYYSRLYYFIFEFIPIDDLTENIVQDTFFTLWNKRHKLTDNTRLGAYLFTVAKNNCLYKLRDQRYRQKLFSTCPVNEIELDLNLDVLSSLDSSSYTFDEIERIIQETLDELPPQCKRVFILSRFEELKNKEIAEELNISVKVVEKHMTKGLKIFRAALKDYLPFVAYLFIP